MTGNESVIVRICDSSLKNIEKIIKVLMRKISMMIHILNAYTIAPPPPNGRGWGLIHTVQHKQYQSDLP